MRPAEAKVMRAIVDREHKRALKERKDAQAAASAPAPATSSTSWSTKPDPSTRSGRAGRAASAADAAREKINEAWRARHPEAAKAERRLRKQRAGLLERWKHKNDGTPETHEHASRCNQGALARLYMSGAIDAEQLAAAVEIATVAERIGADVAVKTASLETRVDMTRLGDGSFYEKLGQVRCEMAYTRWRAALRQAQDERRVQAVLDMLVGEPVGFTIVARRYRMHNRKARQLLIDALNLWPRILGQVRKEVDLATIAAAHAGILA